MVHVGKSGVWLPATPIRKRLGQTLRAWRKVRQLKISSAAAEFGVSCATWGSWETGKKFPSAIHLDLLSEYLGITACQLFRDDPVNCQRCKDSANTSKRDMRHSTNSRKDKLAGE